MNIFSFIKKHPLFSHTALSLALLVSMFSVNAKPAQAAIGVPFGGLVSWMYPCTCSPGTFMVYLWLPRPGIYAITPWALGPLLFLDKVVAPGSWLLGSYVPGAQSCIMYYGVTCAPFPVMGTITMTGTSL